MALVTDKKIGVLMGGLSSERDVSLASGRAVLDALRGKGHDAVAIDIGRDAAARVAAAGIGVAFIALHGKFGEDGAIQGMLEVMGIPYTGSGILASAMGMNKAVAKRMFKADGLLVGRHVVVTSRERHTAGSVVRTVGLPAVIKPNAEGSSVGVTIVSKENEVEAAVDLAFRYGGEIIIEQYLAGKEVQVGILGDRALGAIEIEPKDAFYSYRAKYEKGMSDHFFPARIPEEQYRLVLEAGLAAHRSLGCRGYSRVDFIVDAAGNPYILEVNTLPGMTATSLLPEIAKGVGIEFPELVEEIVRLALMERVPV
jgi:D-alanine-D-alanine ligase